MRLRKLLVILMGGILLATSQGSANGNLCVSTIKRTLRVVDRTVRSDIRQLQMELKGVHTLEDLRIFLADPKVGGRDGRKDFFMIQGYSQVLRHYKKGEGIRNKFRALINDTFKEVEDEIGKYSEFVELAETARMYEMPPAFVAYVQGKADLALQVLYRNLTEKGWLGDDQFMFTEISEALDEFEWPESVEQDHKLFFRALRDTFEAYDDKMLQKMYPLLLENQWDYSKNMENGLHEVRRLLRWVMIFVQMRPEAFSYSKELAEGSLSLRGKALDVADRALKDALEKHSQMTVLSVGKKGKAMISPEDTFYISGLVDQLGGLKRKSEIYFKLQNEITDFLSTAGEIPGLTKKSSLDQIQSYIINASAKQGYSFNLVGTFVAGAATPFHTVRKETLELLEPFWVRRPLRAFRNAADSTKDYWGEQ